MTNQESDTVGPFTIIPKRNEVIVSFNGKAKMIEIHGEILDCSPMRTPKQVRDAMMRSSIFAMMIGFWIGWAACFLIFHK